MMNEIVIYIFAGIGMFVTPILVVGGIITYFAIKNAPEEEEQ